MDIKLFKKLHTYGQELLYDRFHTKLKVVLEDDKKLFPPYQGAPLLREETLKKYPQLEKILGKLAGKITTEEMTKMNYAVDVEGKSAYEVAKEYLQKEELIGE